MRILHLSTNDTQGGAARAAYRLHTGLQRLGHESRMLVSKKTSGDPSVVPFRPATSCFAKWRRNRRFDRVQRDISQYNKPAGYELFSDDRTAHGPALVNQLPPCDLINLHWVTSLVDYEFFFPLAPAGIPLVWRLADMAALTGGCHYDGGCGKFSERCGACPQLASTNPSDLSREIWNRKNASLRHVLGRLHLVGTSRWIAGQASRSSLLKDFPVSIIPNGLDTDQFAPRDQKAARETLGIPQGARVVLFVADSTDIVRKGYAYLVEALKGMSGVDNLMLVSIGSGKAQIDSPIRQLHVGRISDDRKLSEIYSAADVFVIPSLQESFGQTVVEAMACGTPVIGFNTGGIPDMVRPGITGLLAPVQDIPALRGAIVSLLNDPQKRCEMSGHCRRIAQDEYSLDVQARAYAKLYEQLLTARRQAA